jgi:aspartyl-tRNA(Asn)/glutamyl-tRNA(Gln) amidotransferase subunit A
MSARSACAGPASEVSGLVTPEDLVREFLSDPPDDGSFIRITADQAREDAARATRRLRRDGPVGPLDGVLVAIKDCIDVAGVPTTNGSLVARSTTVAGKDAGIVRMLRGQGAVVVGKTNQSELAFTGLGLNPHYGTPRNPLFETPPRVTGGSSSGSAVAVAAGRVPLAVGTDTSGSARIPAAFCGVVGYKASERRFPMDGVRPLSPLLDSLGIFTRTVAELRTAVDALQPRSRRSHSSRLPARTVVIVPEHEIVTECESEVRAWFDRQLDDLARVPGLVVETRALPVLADAQGLMDDHGTLVAADAFGLYGRYLVDTTPESLDPAVARRLRAASSLGDGVEAVRRSMPALRRRLERELDGALLVCPTVRHRPPLLSEVTASPVAFDEVNARTLRTTMLLSYLGMPGISVPRGAGRRAGFGLLVSSTWGQDDRVLDAAEMIDDPRVSSCRSAAGGL